MSSRSQRRFTPEFRAEAVEMVASTIAVTATPWLVVALYLAHGAKDLWQHRTHFVRGTRWWPPFCLAVDVTVALIMTAQLVAGANFHS